MFRMRSYLVVLAVLLIASLACQLSAVQTSQPATATPIIIVVTATSAPTVEQATAAPVSPTVEPPTPEPVVEVDASATPEQVPTEIVHSFIPISSKPDEKAQTIYDQETRLSASQKEAYAGDEYNIGKFERPFDQKMSYLPYIDIIQVNLYRMKNDIFYMAHIYLEKDPSLLPEGVPGFGIEIDSDLDGRGNYLIWTSLPKSTEWSVEGVSAWNDANLDVGGKTPVKNDLSPEGDGYELKLFDSGVGTDPDLVWSRVSPDDPTRIEITFKKELLGSSTAFVWSAWAAIDQNQLALFDHNDHFTLEQAGSPTKEGSAYYPLKGLYGIDNSCRSASGFTPDWTIIGLCPKALQPTPESSGDNCRWVVVPCTTLTIACFATSQWVCD